MPTWVTQDDAIYDLADIWMLGDHESDSQEELLTAIKAAGGYVVLPAGRITNIPNIPADPDALYDIITEAHYLTNDEGFYINDEKAMDTIGGGGAVDLWMVRSED
jgi:hypothetical protein